MMNLRQIFNDLSFELIFRFLLDNLDVTGNITVIVIALTFKNEIKMLLSIIIGVVNKVVSKFYNFFVSNALYFKFFVQKMNNERRCNKAMRRRIKNKELSDWLNYLDKEYPDCTIRLSDVQSVYQNFMKKADRRDFLTFAIFDYISEIVRFQSVNKLIGLKRIKIVFTARLSEKQMSASTRYKICDKIDDYIREIHEIENEIIELNDMKKEVKKMKSFLPKNCSSLEEEKESS